MLRGLFLCVDGVDACGKSTHVKLLASWLVSLGYDVVRTDEPTHGAVGRIIKRSLIGKLKLPIETEALLFAADRAQHIAEFILPALKKGKIVITERYVYSSLAYQSARGLPVAWVELINKRAIKPDLTIVVDVPVEVALERMKNKRRVDEFESDLKLQQRVRQNYLDIARRKGLKVINGNRPINDVQADIRKLVGVVLKKINR